MFDLSLIFPVHDQADHLDGVVRELWMECKTSALSFEIILVVNSCSDGSLEIAQALAQETPIVRVIQTEQAGWGQAVRLGIQSSRGRVVLYSNLARTHRADLSVFLNEAPRLVQGQAIRAVRLERESWFRELGSKLFHAEVRALFRLQHKDINATPKCLLREDWERMEIQSSGDLIDLEILVKSQPHRLEWKEWGKPSEKRHGGRSTTRIASALKIYRETWKTWRTEQWI